MKKECSILFIKKFIKKIIFWNLFSSKIKEKLKNKLGIHNIETAKEESVTLTDSEVALFFSGQLKDKYQIEQWLKPLGLLACEKPFLFIVKEKEVFLWLKANTNFSVVYYKNLNSLIQFYETHPIKVILYVNNGLRNFHSLIYNKALHVHINHGESDKVSTLSNQSKAYDYLFVSGNAGYEKYKLNLLKNDMSRFIKIGRPQLEHIEAMDFDKEIIANKKIILYAPTWEGMYESMNYSSLLEHGQSIVTQLLEEPNYYLLYKPHPNTGTRDPIFKKTSNQIIKILSNSSKGEIILNKDINALYPYVDLAIFDNSAVAIDYLYVDKPMIMVDMFYKNRTHDMMPTIVHATKLLILKELDKIVLIIENELTHDSVREKRSEIKDYFLGSFDYLEGESTQAFIQNITDICSERDTLLINLKFDKMYSRLN